MKASDTQIAYVRPLTDDNGKQRGELVFPQTEKTLKYFARNLELKPGFFKVTFSYGDYCVFIDQVTPCQPEEIGTVDQIIRTLPRVSKRSKKALSRELYGMSTDEALERLGDTEFLAGLPGIGPTFAEQIAAAVGSQDDHERELLRVLGTFGIEADVSASWYRYLRFYFASYEGIGQHSFEDVEANPYLLCRIVKYHSVRRHIKTTFNTVPGRKLTFEFIDEHALRTDPRWQYHKARAIEIITRVLEEAKRSGDTVVELNYVAGELRRRGVSYLIAYVEADEIEEMSNVAIRQLVSRSNETENVRFMRANGSQNWGVCLRLCKRWRDTTVEAVTHQLDRSLPLGRKETETMLRRALSSAAFELTDQQQNALKNAFGSCVSAITGGAGTGKTTLAQCYLSGILQARRARSWKNPLTKRAQKRTGHNIYILAPTGVATQRIRNGLALEEDEVLDNGLRRKRMISLRRASSHGIEERTRHLDSGDVYIGTLHSFLGYKGSGFFDIPPPHPSIIYIDEASMIDCEVMYHLARYMLRCIEENVSILILFSGDHHQLPPVGPGYPFRDLMGNAFGASIPITELTEVKRQEKGSMIAHAADNVKHVRIVPSPRDYSAWGIPYDDADFVWHDPAEMPGMQVTDILTNYAAYLTRTRTRPVDVRDIQVILPLRNQSRVEPEAPHTRALNQALQQHYSGGNVFSLPARRSDDSDLFTAHFAVGDKVIHVGENGYTGGSEPINRGSIGFIKSITHKDDDVRVDVAYPWLEDTVGYCEPTEVGQLDLAYAITGHASQGSEYDFVLITLPARAGMNPRTGESMVDRNWLYTTLTRGKKHVMLIAPTFRLQNAVGQSSGQARNTLLALELLRI